MLFTAAALFGVLALIAGGLVAWGVIQFNSIDRVAVDLDKVVADQPRNILIVGSDTREDLKKGGVDDGAIFGGKEEAAPSGKRADTLVVARVDPNNATVELLSVPRDLWVDGPSTGRKGRVNAAYNGGAQALVDTIQGALDIPINNYVEVNFNGFKGLVDALQGVPMYFDRAVYDERSGLRINKSGCHTLNGVQALAFARSRHLTYNTGTKWATDPTGDLGRITRQQIFIRHALQKVAALGVGDVDSMRVLVGVAVNNVTIDDSLSSGDMIDLGRKFSAFDPSKMVTHRLETQPYTTSGGADVVTLDGTASSSALDVFRGRAPEQPAAGSPVAAPVITPDMVTVDVMNTTTSGGLARQAADKLVAGGFKIGNVSNAAAVDETVIRFGKGADQQAAYLATRITPAPNMQADSQLAAGTVELDLAGVLGTVATAPAAAPAAAGPAGVPSDPTRPETPIGVSIGDPPPGIRCG